MTQKTLHMTHLKNCRTTKFRKLKICSKIFCYCPILLDFFILFRTSCPTLHFLKKYQYYDHSSQEPSDICYGNFNRSFWETSLANQKFRNLERCFGLLVLSKIYFLHRSTMKYDSFSVSPSQSRFLKHYRSLCKNKSNFIFYKVYVKLNSETCIMLQLVIPVLIRSETCPTL